MKNILNLLLLLICVSFFTTSCQKENKSIESHSQQDFQVQLRTTSSPCDIQSIEPELDYFKEDRVLPIYFDDDVHLYDPNALLYQYCKGTNINITYDLGWIGPSNNRTYYLTNLRYNMADLFTLCPDLYAAYLAAPDKVDFLNRLEREISEQLEKIIIYNNYAYFPPPVEVSVKYIRSLCYVWQWQQYPNGPVTLPFKTYCNEEVCCVRTNSYVFIVDNNNVVVDVEPSPNTTFQLYGGQCPEECEQDCEEII
jgi:hypothetical protein